MQQEFANLRANLFGDLEKGVKSVQEEVDDKIEGFKDDDEVEGCKQDVLEEVNESISMQKNLDEKLQGFEHKILNLNVDKSCIKLDETIKDDDEVEGCKQYVLEEMNEAISMQKNLDEKLQGFEQKTMNLRVYNGNNEIEMKRFLFDAVNGEKIQDNVYIKWKHFESMLAVLNGKFQTYRRWYDNKGGYLIFGCWLKGSVKMKNRLVAGKNAPNIELWLLPVQFAKHSVDQVDVAVGGFQLWLLPVQFTKPSVDQVDVDVGGFRLSNL